MEVFLVRHTTPKIAKGICYGQSDLEVTNSFIEEANLIHEKLPILDEATVVFSSPLQRCTKLAQTYSNTVILDNRLKELDFGDWELKAWDAIPKEDITPWMENFVHYPTKNGESYIDLHKRTNEFINELKENKASKAIIFTHAGVMRSIWAAQHNTPLEKSFELKLIYGQVLQFTLS